jgi:uncharacterized protein YecA (UPF0149 family)
MTSSKNTAQIEKNDSQALQEHVHGPNCNHEHGHPSLKPITRVAPKVGRNDPCSCGSQKKFKKCCGQ